MATSSTTTTTNTSPTPITSPIPTPNLTPLSPEDELKAIKKQVEFYFSDSNYPRDKFLKAQVALSHEGYVPISVLLSFQRMKSFTLEKVVQALASSTLVQLNETNTGVRRTQPASDDDTSIPRTIYVKGWPAQTTIEGVEKFYAPFGTVLSVRFRRFDDTKLFKGSLFVEFATEEEAQKVYNIKPIPQAFSEVTTTTTTTTSTATTAAGPSTPALPTAALQYLMKSEWTQEKHEESQRYKTSILKKRSIDSEEKKNQKKQKKTKEEGKVEIGVMEKKGAHPPGMLVKFSNIPPGFTRLSLKPIFEEYGAVRFIDYQNDKTEGYVRYGTAKHPLDMMKGFKEKNTLIGGQAPTLHLVTEEEEKEYWTKLLNQLPKDKDKKSGRGGKGGKFQKGGKGKNFKKGGKKGKGKQEEGKKEKE